MNLACAGELEITGKAPASANLLCRFASSQWEAPMIRAQVNHLQVDWSENTGVSPLISDVELPKLDVAGSIPVSRSSFQQLTNSLRWRTPFVLHLLRN